MKTNTVAQWVAGLEDRDSQAIQELWNAYFSRLVRLAHVKLAGTPQQAFSDEDIALSAFKSFCFSAEQGRFPRVDDESDLWRILVHITAQKVIDRQRHESRQKRGGTRSRSAVELETIVGREPSPEFAALLADELQSRLHQLPEDLRKIAVAKSEGYTNDEIAAQLSCAPRTVERRLCLIRRMWTEPEAGES